MPRVSGGGERRGQSGGVSDEVSDAAASYVVRPPSSRHRPSHARSPISAISRAKAGRHSLIRCAIGLLFARVQG